MLRDCPNALFTRRLQDRDHPEGARSARSVTSAKIVTLPQEAISAPIIDLCSLRAYRPYHISAQHHPRSRTPPLPDNAFVHASGTASGVRDLPLGDGGVEAKDAAAAAHP